MADSYVCSGAMMRCTMGTSPAKLTVLPIRTVFLTGQPMANISDHLSMVNLAPFGLCRSMGFPSTASATAANHGTLTPMPCMHNTPFPWMNGKNDYIVKGDPALLKSSTCQCIWGGDISIIDDGQHGEGTQWVSKSQQEEFEKDQIKTDGLSADDILDGIQMTLDVAGMVPIAGAAPDLLNAAISACRGNWADAGMSLLAAVPGAGDAVGGVKIVKNGVKIANKVKKGAEAAEAGAKVAKGTEKVTKNNNMVSMAEHKAAKLDKQIAESDNVVKFPNNKKATFEDSSSIVNQKGDNVVKMDYYQRKVEKQVNGPDKVTVVKKENTIIKDSINPVNPSNPPKGTGSSTSYGSGQGSSNPRSGNSSSWKINRIKVLETKKKNGTITPDEKKELEYYTGGSGSIFSD